MTKIAAIQMVSSEDVSTNLVVAERLIKLAASQEAQLIVLPENFALLSGDETAKLSIKEHLGHGPLQQFLAEQAKRYKVTVVGGTIPIQNKDSDKVFASTLVFNAQGECVSHYNKIHLFDVNVGDESYFESRTVDPGKDVVVVDLPFARIGLSICYDIRFPELYRLMQMRQVDIIVIPAAFTDKTGKAHWEVLTRARAIENLCYVIAADQGGIHPGGRMTYGHSMIVNPWGEILSQLERGEGVIVADYDRNIIQNIRNSFPAMQHRRL